MIFMPLKDNPRLRSLHGQYRQRFRRSVSRVLATVALTVGLVACSASDRIAEGGLPILTDYPTSINATAASGSLLLQPDGCLVFTRSDGAKMLPVFRAGSSIDKLEAQLGDLASPRNVSIMGLTMLDRVPAEIERFRSNRKCSQTPFVFGNFGSSAALPPTPPNGAPSPNRTSPI